MNKSFKDLMQPGKKNIGTILQVPSEELAEMLGHAGLELIILDMEHCPMTPPKIVSMVRACESVGALPFVRVPDVTDEDAIKKSLDAGACGILVPNIENADQARKAVEYGKFAPVGKRGACPFVRANWFGGEDSGTFAISNSSFVSGTYYKDGKPAGTLGVIGPMRLDYRRIIPYIEYFSNKITRLLSEDSDKPPQIESEVKDNGEQR